MVRLRDFGKKRIFKGWVRPRTRLGLHRIGLEEERPIRNLKRFYRMTTRRVLQLISAIAIGYVVGNEEFIVGMGCFGGVWLCRLLSRGIVNKGIMVSSVNEMLVVGMSSMERGVGAIVGCIFDGSRVDVEVGEVENEIFLLRYVV